METAMVVSSSEGEGEDGDYEGGQPWEVGDQERKSLANEGEALEPEQTYVPSDSLTADTRRGAGGVGRSGWAGAEAEILSAAVAVQHGKKTEEDVPMSDDDQMKYAVLASKQFAAGRKMKKLVGVVNELEASQQAQTRQLADTTKHLTAARAEVAELQETLASLVAELARALEDA
jgi:hypothetical protein